MTRNDPLEAQLELLFSDAVLPDISGSPEEKAPVATGSKVAEIRDSRVVQLTSRRVIQWLLVSLAVVAAISIPVIYLVTRTGQAKAGDSVVWDRTEITEDRRDAVSLNSSPRAMSTATASSQAIAQSRPEGANIEHNQPTPTPGAFVLPNSASAAESTPTQIPSPTPSRQPDRTPTRESLPATTARPSATATAEPEATVVAANAPARVQRRDPEPTQTPHPTRTAATPDAHSAYPRRLVIPAIDLDAPIQKVGYTNIVIDGQRAVTWAVPNSFAAGWHHTSAPLGQPGNTVLNGHESVGGGVFRDIARLRPNDEIIVYAGSAAYRFRVSERHTLVEEGQPLEVRSSNARWIMPTGDERLTLVTCAPHAESTHRLIVVALPLE